MLNLCINLLTELDSVALGRWNSPLEKPARYKFFLQLLSMLIITASCSAINLFTGAVVAECDALSQQNLRDTCYAEIGIIRQNINLCDRAENEGSKYYCYEGIAETTNSSTICTDIEDSYWRNVCFKAVGMNINDASLCAQVTNEELKNTCYL